MRNGQLLFRRVSVSWLIALVGFANSAGAQDITSNLRGHWKLIETSGTTATDSSPTPHNGTYTNGPVLASSTANPIDGAVSAKFDGANDYVAIGTESWFDVTSAITVAAWIKVDVWDVQWQAIVTKGDGAWRLSRDSTNNGVTFACTGLSTLRVSSVTAVNDGKWHHVCGTYSNGILMIFVDGVVDNYVGSTGTIAVNNYNVQIGRNAQVAGREFDGAIYDARVYNRALSLADVAYLCLKTEPVGRWEFDQTSGTTVTDTSIFSSNGTVSGGANWTTRCNGAGVFDFDGSARYVTVPNKNNLLPIWSITVAAWVKGDAWGVGSNVDTIVRKGEANPNNYAFHISDGRVELLLDGNDAAGFRGNTVLSTGQWHHVAATWDGSTVRIYVNGVLDNTPASRTGLTNYDTRPLYIGGRSGADLFDGQIHEVFLYNRALSPAEIAVLAGKSGIWRFNEGAGTTAADSSGAGNNATLSGGATWMTDCAGNKALATNGTGGIAQTASQFTPPDKGAVAFWMQGAGNPSTVRRVFGLGGDWEVRQQPDGTLVFDLCGEGGTSFATTTPVSDSGRWYHVTAMFDSADDSFEIYLDGQLHASGINVNAMVQQSAAVLSFGTRTGTTDYWQGALREFRVYSRKLCASEIAELAGLGAHWKLDESSGVAAADSSGSGRNGVVTGTATWTTGKINNALQLNGATYVTATGLMNSPRNVTLMAWANLTAADSGGAELASIGDCFAIRLNEGTQSRAFFYNGSSWLSAGVSQTFTGAGWRHFAAVFDDDNNTFKFYVNGVQGASTSTTASIVYTGLGANTLLGRHGNGANTYDFTGKIDDVRIYSRALCPSEILQIFNASGGSFQGVRILQWVETR